MNILNLEHVSKKYVSKEILTDVTIGIEDTDRIGVVGINGTGKSSLLRVLAGKQVPDEGAVSLDPNVQVSFLSQNPDMMEDNTVLEQVFAGYSPDVRELMEYEAKAMLTRLGITDFDQTVGTLSGGQRKRVALATVLLHPADVMILDEPTAGQDYRNYTKIMEFLKGLNERGITIVMITHDMHLMLEYADRSIVFSDGRIIADMSCAEVLTNKDIVDRASLKETSLYHLAGICDISDGTGFVQSFIRAERLMR